MTVEWVEVLYNSAEGSVITVCGNYHESSGTNFSLSITAEESTGRLWNVYAKGSYILCELRNTYT